MHKPGTDPLNVQISDVLCDFCGGEWREDLPVVEGHRGSIICGECLRVAYRALALGKADAARPAAEGYSCIMCLERRNEPGWRGTAEPVACICSRCCRQSAGVLHKDKDWDWTKPTE